MTITYKDNRVIIGMDSDLFRVSIPKAYVQALSSKNSIMIYSESEHRINGYNLKLKRIFLG